MHIFMPNSKIENSLGTFFISQRNLFFLLALWHKKTPTYLIHNLCVPNPYLLTVVILECKGSGFEVSRMLFWDAQCHAGKQQNEEKMIFEDFCFSGAFVI